MSIARALRRILRAFRSLIAFARAAFFIKDLKDLDNGTTRISIDIKVLKDLKRIVTMEIAGETRSDARLASEDPALREHRDQEVSPTGN